MRLCTAVHRTVLKHIVLSCFNFFNTNKALTTTLHIQFSKCARRLMATLRLQSRWVRQRSLKLVRILGIVKEKKPLNFILLHHWGNTICINSNIPPIGLINLISTLSNWSMLVREASKQHPRLKDMQINQLLLFLFWHFTQEEKVTVGLLCSLFPSFDSRIVGTLRETYSEG